MSSLPRRWLIPALSAAGVLAHHAAWFAAFPQYGAYPPDQSGYLAGGRELLAAFSTILHGGASPELLVEIRRWFDFFGVALFYGAIDALRPNDLGFTRGVLAVFNALAAVGAYSLACRLATPLAGALALGFFVVSPAFPSGASRLYPDAATGCFIVWSVRLFVEGGRSAVVAGLLLGTAMLIRVQLLPWVPLALALLTALAWLLRVSPETRRRIRLGWLGLLGPLLLFALLTHFGLENKNDSAPKHNLPRYHYYAYGVWQYLESDGWEGPWRLKQDPFYAALVEKSATDPGILKSRPRQYVFAAQYLAARLDSAIPIVLGNFYRIFNRPQNPEYRGFVRPQDSTLIHRIALICALVAAVRLWNTGNPGLIAPLLVFSLGAFHALAWGWPRYAMPVLPILLALSGMGLEIVLASLRERLRPWLLTLAGVALLFLAGLWVRDVAPEVAWSIRVAALVGGLWVPLYLTRSGPAGPSGRTSGVVALALGTVVFGNAWRDRGWHEVDLSLRAGDVVRQEIPVDPGALAQLRAARERYLAVDLELRDSSRRPWDVTVNGVPTTLLPSIPPLPESIPIPADGRAYPQWWIATLTDEMIDRASGQSAIVAELRIDDPGVARLKGDRFTGQAQTFEAPSLGDWPHAAGIKPEYDRDYRLVQRMTLSSRGTRTVRLRAGISEELKTSARIRVFEFDDRSGWTVFETRGTGSPRGLLGFAARAAMRDRGEAEILVAGVPAVSFRIATFRNAVWTNGPFTLCYRDRTVNRPDAWEARGIYLLKGPIPCGETCEVKVLFWPGMDDRPMTFGPELARNQPTALALEEAATECAFDGPVTWAFGRLIDGAQNSYPTDRGRWRVARIY